MVGLTSPVAGGNHLAPGHFLALQVHRLPLEPQWCPVNQTCWGHYESVMLAWWYHPPTLGTPIFGANRPIPESPRCLWRHQGICHCPKRPKNLQSRTEGLSELKMGTPNIWYHASNPGWVLLALFWSSLFGCNVKLVLIIPTQLINPRAAGFFWQFKNSWSPTISKPTDQSTCPLEILFFLH